MANLAFLKAFAFVFHPRALFFPPGLEGASRDCQGLNRLIPLLRGRGRGVSFEIPIIRYFPPRPFCLICGYYNRIIVVIYCHYDFPM